MIADNGCDWSVWKMVRERGSVSLALADLCVRFLPHSQVPLSSRVRHKQTIIFNDKETENGIMCVLFSPHVRHRLFVRPSFGGARGPK